MPSEIVKSRHLQVFSSIALIPLTSPITTTAGSMMLINEVVQCHNTFQDRVLELLVEAVLVQIRGQSYVNCQSQL